MEGLIQILDDILRIFQTYTKANKALLKLRWIQMDPLIITRLWKDQTFIMSQRNRKRHHFQMGAKLFNSLIIGLQSKLNHTTKPFHVLLGQFMLRMRFQAWVRYKCYMLALF